MVQFVLCYVVYDFRAAFVCVYSFMLIFSIKFGHLRDSLSGNNCPLSLRCILMYLLVNLGVFHLSLRAVLWFRLYQFLIIAYFYYSDKLDKGGRV